MDAILLPHSRFSLLEKKNSHRWNLTECQNGDAADYGGDLETVDYPVVGDVVDGVEDDQVAGIDDGHQAERDERSQPDCFDGQVHHNQQCQVKLAKIHPKVQVWSFLQNTPNNKNLNTTGSIRLQDWSSSNLNQTLTYWIDSMILQEWKHIQCQTGPILSESIGKTPGYENWNASEGCLTSFWPLTEKKGFFLLFKSTVMS